MRVIITVLDRGTIEGMTHANTFRQAIRTDGFFEIFPIVNEKVRARPVNVRAAHISIYDIVSEPEDE